MRRETPKTKTIIMEARRRASAGKWNNSTSVERKRVKSVKLPTKPTITPNGRDLSARPPEKVVERTMGRTGSMHGERIVTIPAKKENIKSIII
jgi:hypothetical protein